MKFVLLIILVSMFTPAFAQNSTENSVRSINNFTETTIAVFGVIITAIVGFSGFYANRINQKYQRKQLQTTTLFKVFELLSDDTSRQYRKFIYDAYKKNAPNPDFSQEVLFENKSIPLEKVVQETESRFDKVCALVTTQLLDKNVLLQLYGVMIVKSYIALKQDIDKKQIKDKKAVVHFSTLAKEFDSKIPKKDTEIY